MLRTRSTPIALTIAGSDSGGGAGIQADLKTFSALGVHGTTAITCLTAQNPKAVMGIEPCSEKMVARQIEAVFAELPPAAVKTGMLYSAGIIRILSGMALHWGRVPLVVDPVMVSTSGARLLKDSAIRALEEQLLPRATLVTPNLDEAVILSRLSLRTLEDLRTAAKQIHRRFGCAALVKGGHLRGGNEAADIFFDGKTELLLTSPFVRGVSTHGTGCTYSAAITGFLARGESLPDAVALAKEYISSAIRKSRRAGRYSILNHFGTFKP